MPQKRKLVIIGNGMAGARLAEDVLARGGRELFDVVMFGDEPYGNYNRILLSGVLSGSHDPKDIFINPLAWYETNCVKLHAGVRVTEIDREAKQVIGAGGVTETYDHLVIATGSSPFIPPLEGLYPDDERGAIRNPRIPIRIQKGRIRLSHARRLRGDYELRLVAANARP